MVVQHVAGKNKGRVMLYALSTCQWCHKTKKLLQEMGIGFDYEYVDLLEGPELESAISAVEKVNPKGSFPTLVIDGKRSIVGFRESEIREALS
ncbi:MAG TPA: glutaredoxin family protein [Methanoregulaceae archaeon]|nr:glutaredoxin family protein [Methanoregulaceae archaeon]